MARPDTAEASRLGPFRNAVLVHQGNYSAVYRCREPGLGREVAIKCLRDDSLQPHGVRRLLREARVRASVNHPGILPLHRLIRSRPGPFLVGPWLEGGSLATRIAPLPAEAVLTLASDLSNALDALHAAGWVHGDLNRGNVLFTGDGRAVLSDFATARRLGGRWHFGPGTAPMELTPPVLSPEAWRGERVDGRSDQYALGAILYCALTGAFPFQAEDPLAYAELHCHASVPLPSSRAAVGRRLDEVLLRALAKDPAERHPSCGALAADLREALAQEPLAAGWRQPSAPEPPRRSAPSPRASLARSFTLETLRSTGEHLEQFARTLSDRERAALQLLLEQVRVSEARAVAELAAMTTELFGLPAALLALEQTGAAVVLAGGARTSAEVSAACGAPLRTIRQILAVLSAAGLIEQHEERFRLRPTLATLYLRHAPGGPEPRPIRDAAEFWNWLPSWAESEEPFLRMDRPDGEPYATSVDALRVLYGQSAQRLAAALRGAGRVPRAAALLDVGAGSAVWSLAIASGDPEATVTAVDRPAVLERAREHAEAIGVAGQLTPLAGDWRDVSLPAAAFDLAILANLCHLESGKDVATLIARVARALRPRGRIVVVDTIPDPKQALPLSVLLHGLRLGLRTPRGGIHDLESYSDWMRRAGLHVEELLPLEEAEDGVSALIARRSASRKRG